MARSETFDAIIRLKDQASTQLTKLESKLQQHEKAWERTGRQIQRTFGKVSDAGQFMTTRLTLPLVAAGTAGFNFAADLEDAIGASEQIYKDSAKGVQEWATSLPTYYGIAKKEAITYANNMGAMFKNIGGLSEEEAAKQTQKLIELAGDASAMFGGSTEDAMYAFQAALKGNNTMLDNYGMGVNAATIKTKALEMGLESANGELTLADKQAATVALIMEQMADSEGQASREAEAASGSIKAFKTAIIDLATSIGETLLPIITPMLQKANDIMLKFDDLSETQKKAVVVIGMVVAAIGPLLLIIGQLGMAFGGLMMFAAGAPALLGSVAAAFTFLTGPIGIVIAALGVMTGAIVWLNRNQEMLKEKTGQAIEFMAEKWTAFKEVIGNALSTIGQAITARFLSPLNSVLSVMNAIGNSKVGKALTGGRGFSVPRIGSNAAGTNNWRGGLTTVHEKGGELIDLKAGARIYPHDKSIQMAFQDGVQASSGGSTAVSFDGAVFHVREEADINKIGAEIARRLTLSQRNKGRVMA